MNPCLSCRRTGNNPNINNNDNHKSINGVSCHDHDHHHPLATASWWSRLCFAWPWPLLKLGLERPLTNDDLAHVLHEDSSQFNLKYLQQRLLQLHWDDHPVDHDHDHHHHENNHNNNNNTNNKNKDKNNNSKNAHSLHWILLKDYWSRGWIMQPLKATAFVAKVVQAICLGFLIDVFERNDDNNNNNDKSSIEKEGYYWAMGIVLCGTIILFEFHQYAFFGWRIGMQYRIAFVAAIFEKIVCLSSTHSETLANNGRIMNLASNDVERFIYTCIFISWLIWAPIQAIGILIVGLWLLGTFAFAIGVVVLILFFVPLQMYFSGRFAYYRSTIATMTDRRANFVSQAIHGSRVMKLSGYETQFLQRIQALRHEEVQRLQAAMRLRAANEALFFATNVVISLVIFLVHVYVSKEELKPAQVFTVFTLVNVMQLELVKHCSLAMMNTSECYVSVGRLQEFLDFPEQQRILDDEIPLGLSSSSPPPLPMHHHVSSSTSLTTLGPSSLATSGVTSDTTIKPLKQSDPIHGLPCITMKDVCCKWDAVQYVGRRTSSSMDGNGRMIHSAMPLPLALENVTVEFEPGTLSCVIGPVGGGKSALLLALAKELAVSSGSIHRNYQTMAYAAQDPWVMDGTIQENILMGYVHDESWYSQVITSCSLTLDFEQLRDGDQTIVGDRGVQLSGGQRARIGLARALYKRPNVLLADDPLSAVDARVGRHLFQQALLNLSVLQQRTCVILATHQHQYVHNCRCLYISTGQLQCIGTYQECIVTASKKTTIKAHEEFTVNDKTNQSTTMTTTETTTIEFNKKELIISSDQSQSTMDQINNEGVLQPFSWKDRADDSTIKTSQQQQQEAAAGAAQVGKQEQQERNHQGLVQPETYRSYLKSMGGIWVGLFLLFLYMCTQGSVLFTTATMARWAERDEQDQTNTDIIVTVVTMSALVMFLAAFRAYISLGLTLRASQRLHDRMAAAVLRAKIEFFDTNPLGRILNRFNADIGIVDDQLPQTLLDFFVITFIVFGAVITTLTTLPFALVVLPFLIWYFVRVRRIFVTSTRELKRLEGIARSPIFAMLSEALGGIATIRANDYTGYLRQKFQKAHDTHTRTFFAFISASRWVGFRMDSIVFMFTSIVSILAVVVQAEGWFDIDPAILGLALSMLIYLSGMFQWCIRQSAEAVNQMVGVERVLEFGNLESEPALRCNPLDNELISKGWPMAGKIEYENVSVRYRAGLPLALRQISFQIPAGARVGVVGRTGSGKSTVVQTLFRLLEVEEGRILIDDQDISKVGLHTLRPKISVIPQVPTLFSGCTIRENLDLFHLHSDNEIQDVLSSCRLVDAIKELPQGWNSIVLEGGSNFSVGQRQLLCLARALLSKNKVLVLDEATASVDRRTDQLLQQALQESYKDGTILAVAHRLDTVINYDYILVLGHGEVLEFGSPADLLLLSEDDETTGVFSQMVHDTGEVMSNFLHESVRSHSHTQKKQYNKDHFSP